MSISIRYIVKLIILKLKQWWRKLKRVGMVKLIKTQTEEVKHAVNNASVDYDDFTAAYRKYNESRQLRDSTGEVRKDSGEPEKSHRQAKQIDRNPGEDD